MDRPLKVGFEKGQALRIGILHPGDMGASVGHCARLAGNEVWWSSDGRSARTRERAQRARLNECANLDEIASRCELLVSVCPPQASGEVAAAVLDSRFRGVFVDANAISPERSRSISATFDNSGIAYVDGGIVGPAAWRAGSTRLYLSGAEAGTVANAFAGGPLEPRVIDERIGSASAMKMCFAAWNKGRIALAGEVLAAAEHFGVSDFLRSEWGSDATDARTDEIRRIAGRAWRWEPEMHEIAATLDSAGLPDGMHLAAAEIYRRLESYKDCAESPEWEALLAALLERTEP